MGKGYKRIVGIGVLVLTVALTPRSISGQRSLYEADWWHGLPPVERQIFVNAYTLGYLAGLESGCKAGTSGWPGQVKSGYESERLRRCRNGSIDFSKGTDYLVKAITDFYRDYPGDDDIRPDEVLEQIGRGLTAEQIHKYPFWRRTAPPEKP